ncbi:thioredoxin domain protein [Natronomonas pharaonis DSM 2160]|uniref:Thioredoxin domain protein n=1 Tax=Natronomonas pharaonis (strain ATCC 35678 / DSM 2160 / CIP 103997 / JCM 8858 / NBRC 14720 / NCIMB 2260 / Gabara) TaxID=348780 RepID=A0A1U7EYI6_NATPD|nr:thioredoxin family protein [Natronomonas pharaonis]CAI50282.1 thioredoxin domain protein [Natronomonas pharaonis DSM 2160]
MNPRKVITIAVLVAVLGFGYYSMNAAPVLSDHDYTYQGGLQWHEDPDEALSIAQDEDKPVLVYYWTTWCTYCQTYDENHYQHDEIRDTLDAYTLLAINLDDPGPGASMAADHGASYPPQHVMMTPDGEEISQLGGFVERDQFLQEIESALGAVSNE